MSMTGRLASSISIWSLVSKEPILEAQSTDKFVLHDRLSEEVKIVDKIKLLPRPRKNSLLKL